MTNTKQKYRNTNNCAIKHTHTQTHTHTRTHTHTHLTLCSNATVVRGSCEVCDFQRKTVLKFRWNASQTEIT